MKLHADEHLESRRATPTVGHVKVWILLVEQTGAAFQRDAATGIAERQKVPTPSEFLQHMSQNL